MTPIMSICARQGCGQLIPHGQRHCRHHAQQVNERKHAAQRRDGRDRSAWRTIRALVIQRDGACGHCGSAEKLTAHYLPGGLHSANIDDYETLCLPCHSQLHRNRGGAVSILDGARPLPARFPER